MTIATARAEIYSVVNAVTNSGKVYDYDRLATDWGTFLNLFRTTIGGRKQILGYTIGYNGAAATDAELDPRAFRSHRFVVRGYMSLNDEKETEKTAANLAETIANALDDSATLHDGSSFYNTEPAQIEIFEARVFGDVLVHYTEIGLVVTEFVA